MIALPSLSDFLQLSELVTPTIRSPIGFKSIDCNIACVSNYHILKTGTQDITGWESKAINNTYKPRLPTNT
jgi:hypothetical protein